MKDSPSWGERSPAAIAFTSEAGASRRSAAERIGGSLKTGLEGLAGGMMRSIASRRAELLPFKASETHFFVMAGANSSISASRSSVARFLLPFGRPWPILLLRSKGLPRCMPFLIEENLAYPKCPDFGCPRSSERPPGEAAKNPDSDWRESYIYANSYRELAS